MTGLPRAEYMESFAQAEKKLRELGYNCIVNPTRIFACRYEWMYHLLVRLFGAKATYTLVLLYDLWQLSRCNLIYKLPGWQQSRGCNIESCVAYWFRIWSIPQKQKRTKRMNDQMEEISERWLHV